jgi:hypothetical protein
MQLSAEIVEEIASQVADGYYDRDAIIGTILSFYADELEIAAAPDGSFQLTDVPAEAMTALDAAIAAAFAAKAEAMRSWPAKTDCDRLRDVFRGLTERGWFTQENCGVTLQEGAELAWSHALDQEAATGARPAGLCFFHQQDVMSAMDGDGLLLCFGIFEDSATPAVIERCRAAGEIVAAACRDKGFDVEWDGTPDTRILLRGFRWQHRGPHA